MLFFRVFFGVFGCFLGVGTKIQVPAQLEEIFGSKQTVDSFLGPLVLANPSLLGCWFVCGGWVILFWFRSWTREMFVEFLLVVDDAKGLGVSTFFASQLQQNIASQLPW